MNLNLRKILAVCWMEYRHTVVSKTFLFLLLLSPVMIGIAVVMAMVAEGSRDLNPRRFAVVDRTERLLAPLLAAAEQRNEHDIFQFKEGVPPVQTEPRFIPKREAEAPGEDEQALILRLSEKVREGELFAFVIVEAGVLETPDAEGMVRYFAENRTYQGLPVWIERAVNTAVQNVRLEQAGLNPEQVRSLTRRGSLERFGLAEVDEAGKTVEATETNPVVSVLLPLGAMMILFFCANMSSPIMLNSVMEEKMQKIMEVLLSAVTPVELLAGKLIGSVFVSVTLGLVYLLPSGGFMIWRGYGESIPLELLAWFPAFLLLTLLTLGSVWGAIGAACQELKDTQNFAGFAILLLMLPFFLSMAVLEAPDTPFARWASLVPLFYPFVMTIRLCLPPGPEAWELWVGLALSLGFTAVVVWGGAKIFRKGILAQGQTPSLRAMFGWLQEK